MDEDLYDEFGTYIGPEIEDDFESASSEEDWRGREEHVVEPETHMAVETPEPSSAIVLHEDKKYYPDAEEVYPDAEVLVQEEDTQALSEPIVKPIKHKKAGLSYKPETFPPTTFTKEYMQEMMDHPHLLRCITILGHLHHGKTTFVQTLVDQTHTDDVNIFKEVKYTDTRFDERERGLSIKATPMSLVLPDSRGKSFLVHFLDTPGHVNFSDEVTASLRLSDGAVLVVDVVEGVMINTERLLKHALQEGVSVSLVLNKMDRLVLELKLPPQDAYYKIKHLLDSLNQIVLDFFQDEEKAYEHKFSPDRGNVLFASSTSGWSFTLGTYAKIYTSRHNRFAKSKNTVDHEAFAKRLWGDKYFDPETRRFLNKPQPGAQRTFVEFILEPLYKLYSHLVGEGRDELKQLLRELGLAVTKEELGLDVKPLIKLVLTRFFGDATGFVDMITHHHPSPLVGAQTKVEHSFSGPMNSEMAEAACKCDRNGPLIVHVSKLFPDSTLSYFNALGRVMSGTIRIGQTLKVLGEHYSMEDEEDMTVQTVEDLCLGEGMYTVDFMSIPAGNWVLIKGVDTSIMKTATLVEERSKFDCYIFHPLRFNTLSVVKIAVEPLNPSELPKMLEGIRKINKTYPLCTTKVEESGEHVILGTGELYLDSIMYDLRKTFTEIEVKVSDPVVTFCETVVETSSLKCFAETPNKEYVNAFKIFDSKYARNKLTMIAQPLEPGIAEDIENEHVSIKSDKKEIQKFFQSKYQWDILSARNIWAFGPDHNGPNVLVNDCLPSEVNTSLLNSVKDHIVQGFDWAAREGPLCEEPIRNVKLDIVHASISSEPILRAGNQIIPTSRRVAYSAFLTARPRLMEPIYLVDIISPPDTITAIYNVLSRRRGHIIEEKKKEGSPFYTVRAYIPVIDSFGFETDMRAHSQGQAFCVSVFHHWDIVPGDPLDRSIVLRPLEDAPTPHLARDFMVKTRRRKGLSEDVSRNKFFDEDLLARIESMGIDLNSYM